jgi:hypothetical protein
VLFVFSHFVLNHKGRTALICAIDRVEVVKLLLVLPGIDYNHKDNLVKKAFINPLIHKLEVCVQSLIFTIIAYRLFYLLITRVGLHLLMQVSMVVLKW